MPRKNHLFTPGPTPVPDAVLRAMSAPIIHHRTEEWQESFGTVLTGLKQLFGTAHDVATFTASGSGAMESAVFNLIKPGDEVSVIAHGRFGVRWAQMSERAGAKVNLLEVERGKCPNPDEVGSFVAAHPNSRAVFMTHSETSTGAVSDAKALAESIRAQAKTGTEPFLVLDAISSLGAAPVEMDKWGYDAIVSGSQKALMVPPGLSFVAISPRALEHARSRSAGRWYFDWAKSVDAHRKTPASTPVTPALTIVLGLKIALELIFKEGLENVHHRHVRLGRATRAAVNALGFEFFSPNDDSSVALTAIKVPPALDGVEVVKAMKEYGVTVAGGQDDLKGKIVRLGHCGWVNELDIAVLISAFERALHELNYPFEVGQGLRAAQQSLLSNERSS